MLSQEKGKFKELGTVFVVFTCLCLTLHHSCGDLCISGENPLISERTKQNYLQVILYICSNLSKVCLKDNGKYLSCLSVTMLGTLVVGIAQKHYKPN